MSGSDQLSAVFSALADPTRRAILAELAERDATVTELTAPLPISMPAVSRHLKALERAGLISRTRSGTLRMSRIEAAPLIPQNDPTLLYINSGMAPLKPYFLGLETPPQPDLSNVQRCIRTNDWVLMGDNRGESRKLYDLNLDPFELRNVVNQHPKLSEELYQQVLQVRTRDSMPD